MRSMIAFPEIEPVLFALGPLKLRWYGLMYIIGFALAWWLATKRAQREDINWTRDQVSDLIFYGALGVILGGRLGYILFYKFADFIQEPSIIYRVWEGGMSFHGGLIGVILAFWYLSHRYKKSLFDVTDFIAPMIPLGLGFGRIGNFINNELWGKPTDLPWAVIPPGGTLGLHPSQLYEAFLEGLVLFLILWLYSSRPRPLMSISGLFLLCYGLFRFIVEFVRLPDADIGYLAFDWLTMGQVLSLPMMIFGYIMIFLAYKKQRTN
jgi:phosphatidylglycerol:prolipoprotein diacylglycerol transferase